MRIDLRDRDRQSRGRVVVDPKTRPSSVPASSDESPVTLDWENALTAEGALRRCPVCRCRDLFRRRDFPQRFGLALVVVAGIASIVLFAMGPRFVPWSIAVLAGVVVIDAALYLFTGQLAVCYRCRSEFRATPLSDEIEPWDLAIGEKYRPIRSASPSDLTADEKSSTGV